MKWFCFGLLVFISACSQRQVYDSIQINQRNECALLSGVQRDECLKRLNLDYQTYERQRQDLLKEKQ